MDQSPAFSAREGVDLPTQLVELKQRLELARAVASSPEAEVLATDLETAYEELRVADEELRAQQEQIAELLESRNMLRWQQERMMGMLPVPAMRTDAHGVVRAVNAAAATLLQIRVARLLAKPILSLVVPEDRSALRRQVSQQSRDGGSFRRRTSLLRRDGTRLEVELSAAVVPWLDAEVTWMVLDASPDGRQDTVRARLPHVLAQLAALATTAPDRQALLQQAAQLCREALGGSAELSLTLGSPLAPTALASTAVLAQQVDYAQVRHGEGPCVTAFEEKKAVHTDDLRHDPRWPAISDDVPAEVGGAIAVPLQSGDDLVGALNVYRYSVGADPHLEDTAEMLAATVGSVVYEFGLKDELRGLAADMERALGSRAVIDQAKGILIAQTGCTADEAFQHLVRLSSTQQVKLREVARRMVERRS